MRTTCVVIACAMAAAAFAAPLPQAVEVRPPELSLGPPTPPPLGVIHRMIEDELRRLPGGAGSLSAEELTQQVLDQLLAQERGKTYGYGAAGQLAMIRTVVHEAVREAVVNSHAVAAPGGVRSNAAAENVTIHASSIAAGERQALVDLYTATGGASWIDHANWNGAAGTECNWYGVTCDDGGTKVQELDLHGNNLVGTLPTTLGSLANLQHLNLYGNQLTGSIPTQLGSLTNLVSLDLGSNQLTGPIPTELGSLTNLHYLYLDENHLTGSIPTQLGSLTNLQELYLSWNQLSGPIPAQLGSLTNLQYLILEGDQLTGLIPTQLGGLTNLRSLSLYDNQLTGSIPTSLGGLTNLLELYVDSNQLSGPIPAQLGSLTNLQYLYLSYNQLTGSIPTQLGSLTNLQSLYLDENQLTGSIPTSLGNLTKLVVLHLSTNQLMGSIPTWLGSLTNLQGLYLGVNQLTGSIPTQLGSLTNLQYLSLYGNQLTGSIPAELSSLAKLQDLRLGANQLTGSIPAELGSLTSLTHLYLYSNQLTGSIPAELSSLTNLRHLYLAWNQLSGPIPTQFGSLTNLEDFAISSNMLTGAIPTSLENLTNLVPAYSDLSYNALYSTDATLTTFLNGKQWNGDWQSTQTVAPAGVAAGATTNTSVALSWTPIAYTGDTGGYQAYYSTTSSGPYTTGNITANKSASSIVVSGLNPGTLYYFVVRTITNPSTNNENTVTSDPSAEVHATTSNGSCTSPSITSQPQSQTITSGQTATLSVIASGSTPLTYQWYLGASGNTSQPVGTNASSFTTPAPTVRTSYWVRVSNSCGHADSATATITVGPAFAYSIWIPVVSHSPGQGGAQWRSDTGLLNRSATSTANVTLRLHLSSGILSGTVTVPASGGKIVHDVAASLGLTNGSAALEVQSDQPLVVTSRTYNQQASGWTYGQGYDGIVSEDGLGATQSALLAQLTQNGVAGQVGTYRTNIGITNTGASIASVTLALFDANGTLLWDGTRDYAPGEWYQYQEPFRTAAGHTDINVGYAQVVVNSGSGVVAYASVADNGSSDPTTITMKR